MTLSISEMLNNCFLLLGIFGIFAIAGACVGLFFGCAVRLYRYLIE